MADSVTLEQIKQAAEVVSSSPDVVRTPLLSHVQAMWPSLDQKMQLFLKLENIN